MGALVVSRRRRRGIAGAAVRADAARLVRELGERRELSVALVGDDEMRRLNAAYRKIDRPTDVLAFPSDHPSLLGDVVISLDTAARQAERHGVRLRDEVRLLLVHGVLHLLGYDHEHSSAEARRMFRKQQLLLDRLAKPERCASPLGKTPLRSPLSRGETPLARRTCGTRGRAMVKLRRCASQ
jgi:rRNA maturation RNase YbeY